MSLRIDTTEWISGSLLIGETGLGVLGSAIPATGESGAGYAYNDLSLPADNAKEICGRITTWPTNGTLFAYEDTSFDYTALSDGADSFAYQLYVDGVAVGLPTTVSLITGIASGLASGSLASIALSAPTATAAGTSAGAGLASGALASISLSAPTAAASVTSPTIGRPASDISNTGWVPSTGGNLYAMLDEVTPDDLDYISTSTLGAVCKMALNETEYPGSTEQKLSIRASSSTGHGLAVTIKDGATTIATRTLALTPTFDLHTITLTSGEIALITSGNLTVEMMSV